MITVIRNDRQARFAHDVYGVKIKEEKPNYKIIGTLNNEGICIYESPNYKEVAITFNIIIDAITKGQKTVFLHPPMRQEIMTKEEFDNSDIHDFCSHRDDEEHKFPCDIYGRPIKMHDEHHHHHHEGWKYEPDDEYQDYYASQHKPEIDGYGIGMTYNNREFNNTYSNPPRNFGDGEPL